jgi:predicted enzyme related to lactoylglutathione lyase
MSPDQPAAWNTYIIVDDAAATTQKVKDAGGKVVAEPMTVMDAGTLAVFQDPEGAFISVWQPNQMPGAELYNQTGSFGWNELNTRDVEGAKAFYSKVFGWGAETNPMPTGGSYTEWKLNGRSIGGAMDITNVAPPDVPPNWLVYFGVENCDEGVAKVKELGGNLLVGPMDIQPGRFAIVQDPQGAVFALFSARAE